MDLVPQTRKCAGCGKEFTIIITNVERGANIADLCSACCKEIVEIKERMAAACANTVYQGPPDEMKKAIAD